MGINYFNRDARDSEFVLLEWLDLAKLLSYPAYKGFSTDDLQIMINESLKVAKKVLGFSMQDGDREGCSYADGKVKVPVSFHKCWRILAENGWMSISNSPAFGGQGLPMVLGGIVWEFFMGANLAIMDYVSLVVGNAKLIEKFGTKEDKELFVEKMYTGVWGGTTCMTEPDAGSDAGSIRTKAVPDPKAEDPRVYKIEGTKRFISAGEHDMAENIIHLVLARIEGAPEGSKGVSLFIVPKIWVRHDGTLGDFNDVLCSGIEHKMGVIGSATCTLNFGDKGKCRGILLGKPNTGMVQIFQVVNESRMITALMALGLAASAYDTARQYAKERIQGRLFAQRHGDRVPIIKHEDVRRMLMNLKAGTEAMRAMIAKVYYLIDVSENDPDESVRKQTRDQVDLFTPPVKAYCSNLGFSLTCDAIEILGGVGYCKEFPVEQYARDSKINSIWEGTTYIQALDLVGRKLRMDGGKDFQDWYRNMVAVAEERKDDPDFGHDYELLLKAALATQDFVLKFNQYYQIGKPALVALEAIAFLNCFSEVFMGQLILDQGLLAREKLKIVDKNSSDWIFYRGKVETARYFCRNILTNVFARHVSLQQEDTSALDIPEEAF